MHDITKISLTQKIKKKRHLLDASLHSIKQRTVLLRSKQIYSDHTALYVDQTVQTHFSNLRGTESRWRRGRYVALLNERTTLLLNRWLYGLFRNQGSGWRDERFFLLLLLLSAVVTFALEIFRSTFRIRCARFRVRGHG